MSKLLSEKRLHVAGGSQLQPHWPAVRSDSEVKGEERAAELFVGDKRCQQWIMLIPTTKTGANHVCKIAPARIITPYVLGPLGAIAAKTLQDMGFTNVSYLEGGIEAWKVAGFPIEQPGKP